MKDIFGREMNKADANDFLTPLSAEKAAEVRALIDRYHPYIHFPQPGEDGYEEPNNQPTTSSFYRRNVLRTTPTAQIAGYNRFKQLPNEKQQKEIQKSVDQLRRCLEQTQKFIKEAGIETTESKKWVRDWRAQADKTSEDARNPGKITENSRKSAKKDSKDMENDLDEEIKLEEFSPPTSQPPPPEMHRSNSSAGSELDLTVDTSYNATFDFQSFNDMYSNAPILGETPTDTVKEVKKEEEEDVEEPQITAKRGCGRSRKSKPTPTRQSVRIAMKTEQPLRRSRRNTMKM